MPQEPIPAALRDRALAKLLAQNKVLAALPAGARARLLPHLGLVDLPVGQQLGDSSGRFARAFFPVAGAVSLVQRGGRESGAIAAVIGSEGLVGLPAFMSAAASRRAVVQCAGYGLALGREQLLKEWARGGSFMRILMRYSRALTRQMSVLAACRAHSLEQRLCTVLLLCLDRLSGQEATLRQEAAGQLLGAEPQQLADTIDRLRQAGLVAWWRPGILTAHDRAGLQARACGCADRIHNDYVRAVSMAQPAVVAATPDEGLAAGPWRFASTIRVGTDQPHSG